MATTIMSVPVYNNGSSNTTQRSARDVCMNDYNYTEDPALANCMNEVMTKCEQNTQTVNGVATGVIIFVIILLCGFMFWAIKECAS